ncbi:GAF domain-containing protein [Spirulina sp. CS-785/01]|uniref:HD-GYP domain-containing protein n=1 Tax=Spirulina sp. CS-785/01 TaxID=3021716 RepID=UPI00232E696D|nr:HD family phosphohydrolase [Spirulina sp. CS-785/01]MDB9314266.1 GAF domain-containing protein [Spirulina sp. CS-785/01]
MTAFSSPSLLFDTLESSFTDHGRVELIEKLLSIGTALSGIQDLQELLHLILSKSREITCSDAGSVFLVEKRDKKRCLVFKVAQNDSLPSASFHEFTIPLTRKSLAGYVALTGRSLNIPDAHNLLPGLPYQLDRNFDSDFNYRTCSVLVLPMQDMEGELIGVLQLINRKIQADIPITPDNALEVTQPYSQEEERIVRSLASQAAISIERNNLQENIENLFEGFVRASVQAIEARDPTTSGHSERVADLTVQLALEVNEVETGRLRSQLFNDRKIQELRYASLLHDFGKISVPETLLNKRKKLYPEQLEVIRQRFAVAQRTLQMDCAEQKFKYLVEHPAHFHQSGDVEGCSHCRQLQELEEQLQSAIAQLQRYLQFIENMNEPEAVATKRFQVLSDELFVELTALAEYRYRDIDGTLKPLLTQEEMTQLMLPRGNLSPEERKAIEAHVTHSYEFLKRIPWTRDLQDIPIIAYRHHEKLDGTGYPLGVTEENIPIQTQMMMIADVYDALTAADRPYKRPLGIGLTLRILREEAEKNKIKDDLVELFIQRQVYQVLGHDFSQTG